ncbi:MAG: UDP-3-O-(3-hydroxymyristoyl)glucosamine N-acyltransferase [Thermodesulfobacteriota bacterium]
MKGHTTKSLAEIAALVGGELAGPGDLHVRAVQDLASAREGEITFVTSRRLLPLLATSRASAVIVAADLPDVDRPAIRVHDPYLAVAILQSLFVLRPFRSLGVSPQAQVGAECVIPAAVTIHPFAVLGDRVELGERVTIHPGAVLGDDVRIGDDSVLHAGVFVGERSVIGSRVVIHPGAVIGADGFGYARADDKAVKIPQVGMVQIDDDVEVGAGVCIDRATFGRTWIRQGAKVDNLVQIGHNVTVGEDAVLVAQAGIAGSATLGRGVILAGQAGVSGHVTLGDGVTVGPKAGVHDHQPDGATVSGVPAIPHREWLRAAAAYRRLPELVKEVRELRRRVAELEERLADRGSSHDIRGI